MPTGYTAELCDGDVPFEKFVLTCARAFGALMSMRDDRLDAPIPEKFEPHDYHAKALAAAAKALVEVRAMSVAECEEATFKEFREAQAAYESEVEHKRAVRDRLLTMRAKVADWKPPTSEHEGLKKFMVEQLDSTIDWDGKVYLTPAKRATPEDWRRNRIASLERDVQYHTEHHRKDVEQADSRTAWVKALRESLKSVDAS